MHVLLVIGWWSLLMLTGTAVPLGYIWFCMEIWPRLRERRRRK